MREAVLIRTAILHYLKSKLPQGWKLWDMNCHQDYDDMFGIYKRLGNGDTYYIPIFIGKDPSEAAQMALHAAYGTEEQNGGWR